MNTYPKQGDDFTITERHGYKLVQDRPMDCRGWSPDSRGHYSGGCKCGKCDGELVEFQGTVERVIYFADNSIEVEVACQDGKTRRSMVSPPSGDVCF